MNTTTIDRDALFHAIIEYIGGGPTTSQIMREFFPDATPQQEEEMSERIHVACIDWCKLPVDKEGPTLEQDRQLDEIVEYAIDDILEIVS